MAKNKSFNDNIITDAVIDDLLHIIQNIRSKHPHPIAYDLIRSHPDLERCRNSLIDEYFSVVAEIEKGKKPSPKARQDYLKRLLSPLKKLNRIHPSGENPYLKSDGTYPFIEEKIWIDREIDIEKYHYDKEKYSINFEYSKPLDWFDPDAKNITIWNEYKAYMTKKKEKDAKRKAMRRVKGLASTSAPAPITPLDAGKTSVEELYKEWLPELTQERIKSKDLLDQILVCYTIKRALNGDKKAIDKLYSLYEGRAIKVAVKMAEKRGLNIRLNISEIDEIKQEAKTILNTLISGLKPEYIIDMLSKKDGKHSIIPLWVENFFFWYLSDHVPKEIDKIGKQQTGESDHVPQELDRIMKRIPSEVKIDYFLNPVAIIDAYTSWQNSPIWVRKFNSFFSRPNKKNNLTTWLFGPNKRPGGTFCPHIKEILKKYDKTGKNKVCKLQEDKIEDKSVSKPSISNEELEDTRNHLTKRGFTARNTEIVIQKLKGCSYAEIAKTNNLSGRQIKRIFKKAKSPETTN